MSAGIKISVLLTRRPDLTREEFLRYWTEHHTPLLAAMPATARVTQRYVQQHTLDGAVDGVPTAGYDGVAEVWVADLDAAAELFASEHYRTVIAADEENFLDRSETRFLYTREHVIAG